MPGLLKDALIHDANGEMASRIALSDRGQAGFADPALGRVCRECAHWGEDGKHARKNRC